MKHITSNDGTVIGFRVSGSGRPLLFVHGTTADHKSWYRVSPHLEQHFSVYAMELFLREVAKIPENELEAYRKSPLWNERISLVPTIPREMRVEQTYRFNAEKFSGLQVQAMLLLGGESPPLYRQAVETLDSGLPNSKIVILPGQQHLAHHTNPELLASEIRNFLLE